MLKKVLLLLMATVVDHHNIVKTIFIILLLFGILLALWTIFSIIKKRKNRLIYSISCITYFLFILSSYLLITLFSISYDLAFMKTFYVDKDNIEGNLNFYLNFPNGDVSRYRVGTNIIGQKQFAVHPLLNCLNKKTEEEKQKRCFYLLETIIEKTQQQTENPLNSSVELAKQEYEKELKKIEFMMNAKVDIKQILENLIKPIIDPKAFYASYFLKKYYNQEFTDDYFKKFDPIKKDLIWPEDLKE